MSSPVFDLLLGTLLQHAHPEIPSDVLQDTRANVLAASASTVRFAVTTDTNELFFATGDAWYLLPFKLYIEPSAPDMGLYQDSSRVGYGEDYVTDKRLSNVSVGGNADAKEGAIRFTSGNFQVYSSGTWRTAVVGLTLREGSDGRLQMQPTGKTDWYDVFTGNSQGVGLNNLPITQQHNTHMGVYPDPQIADGGGATMDNPASNLQLLNRTIHRIRARRMTDAQRAALTAYDTLEGEFVYATDTKKVYISDGAGGLTPLN